MRSRPPRPCLLGAKRTDLFPGPGWAEGGPGTPPMAGDGGRAANATVLLVCQDGHRCGFSPFSPYEAPSNRNNFSRLDNFTLRQVSSSEHLGAARGTRQPARFLSAVCPRSLRRTGGQ